VVVEVEMDLPYLHHLSVLQEVMEEVVEEVEVETPLLVEQETVPQFHHHKEIMVEHLSLAIQAQLVEAGVVVVLMLQEQLAMQVEMVEVEQHLLFLEHH
jgi:hypothetical protein